MVIDYGAESPALEDQPRRPSKSTDGLGEVNAVYKSNESKESHMRNHEEVMRNDEKRLKQDLRDEGKISDA